jgi:phospholipid/cholesterol/gamma-HCH transport system substrate-binding protein
MVLTSGRRAFRAGVGLLVGIIVVVLLAGGINASFGVPFNLSLGLPPGFDYTLNADFKDANGVAQGAAVVIGGNPVGQVTSVHVEGSVAVVQMRIDRSYAPVHQGTIARIRYGTLLAAKYIELSSVGRGSRTYDSGATLPTDQTVTPVDFDQFLSALDPKTRQELQVVIQQAGGGVDGRAAAINDLFGQLRPLSQQSTAPLQTFSAHDPDLDRIVANLASVSQRLAQSHEQLGGLVQNTADVTGTLDTRTAELDGLLLHLANTSQDFDETLAGEETNLHTSVQQFDPNARELTSLVATINTYLHPNVATLQNGIISLNREIGSAVNTADVNGSFLRQYLVNSSCYGSYDTTKCSDNGSASTNPSPTSKPSPTPSPAVSPCPGVSPPPLPSPLPNPLASPAVTLCPSPQPAAQTQNGGGLNLGGLLGGVGHALSSWLGAMLS